MDQKKVSAEDLRGKVVVLDFWATWCSPCMAKMPELQQLYDKHKKSGLEIIGVCFDEDIEKARKAIERLGLTWPQYFLPTDEKARELWYEASDIRSLPRLLLDRAGILRNCPLDELEGTIAKLLEKRKSGERKP